LTGPGARQDLVGAYRWLTIAALRGHGKAQEARAKLELHLSIDQLYRGQAWAEAFEPATGVSPWDPPTVEFLQSKLAGLGYDPGPADGFMGPRTTAALENYKKDRGWVATKHLSEDLLQIIRKEDR
jgi:localization factor PodJL